MYQNQFELVLEENIPPFQRIFQLTGSGRLVEVPLFPADSKHTGTNLT